MRWTSRAGYQTHRPGWVEGWRGSFRLPVATVPLSQSRHQFGLPGVRLQPLATSNAACGLPHYAPLLSHIKDPVRFRAVHATVEQMFQ